MVDELPHFLRVLCLRLGSILLVVFIHEGKLLDLNLESLDGFVLVMNLRIEIFDLLE